MSDFVEYLIALLAPLKNVRGTKMFGGNGIFKEDLMFGLVADRVLYLKVDRVSKPDYEVQGFGLFVYEKKEKKMALAYYRSHGFVIRSM